MAMARRRKDTLDWSRGGLLVKIIRGKSTLDNRVINEYWHLYPMAICCQASTRTKDKHQGTHGLRIWVLPLLCTIHGGFAWKVVNCKMPVVRHKRNKNKKRHDENAKQTKSRHADSAIQSMNCIRLPQRLFRCLVLFLRLFLPLRGLASVVETVRGPDAVAERNELGTLMARKVFSTDA